MCVLPESRDMDWDVRAKVDNHMTRQFSNNSVFIVIPALTDICDSPHLIQKLPRGYKRAFYDRFPLVYAKLR